LKQESRPTRKNRWPARRLVVLGSAGLADGFSLIGAEVHADADPAKVEEVLGQLVKDGSEALVLLESQPGPCRRPLVEPPAQRRRAHRGDRTTVPVGPPRLRPRRR
jgi:hypothetical protein